MMSNKYIDNDAIKNRQFYNKQIINKLSAFIDKYPDLRFGQLLIVLGCVEDSQSLFNEESKDTFKKIENTLS